MMTPGVHRFGVGIAAVQLALAHGCRVIGTTGTEAGKFYLPAGVWTDARNRVYVEFGLVLWASARLGRPVKFTAMRSESFISDYQGRDLYSRVELALDGDGHFLALRSTNVSNVGARCA